MTVKTDGRHDLVIGHEIPGQKEYRIQLPGHPKPGDRLLKLDHLVQALDTFHKFPSDTPCVKIGFGTLAKLPIDELPQHLSSSFVRDHSTTQVARESLKPVGKANLVTTVYAPWSTAGSTRTVVGQVQQTHEAIKLQGESGEAARLASDALSTTKYVTGVASVVGGVAGMVDGVMTLENRLRTMANLKEAQRSLRICVRMLMLYSRARDELRDHDPDAHPDTLRALDRRCQKLELMVLAQAKAMQDRWPGEDTQTMIKLLRDVPVQWTRAVNDITNFGLTVTNTLQPALGLASTVNVLPGVSQVLGVGMGLLDVADGRSEVNRARWAKRLAMRDYLAAIGAGQSMYGSSVNWTRLANVFAYRRREAWRIQQRQLAYGTVRAVKGGSSAVLQAGLLGVTVAVASGGVALPALAGAAAVPSAVWGAVAVSKASDRKQVKYRQLKRQMEAERFVQNENGLKRLSEIMAGKLEVDQSTRFLLRNEFAAVMYLADHLAQAWALTFTPKASAQERQNRFMDSDAVRFLTALGVNPQVIRQAFEDLPNEVGDRTKAIAQHVAKAMGVPFSEESELNLKLQNTVYARLQTREQKLSPENLKIQRQVLNGVWQDIMKYTGMTVEMDGKEPTQGAIKSLRLAIRGLPQAIQEKLLHSQVVDGGIRIMKSLSELSDSDDAAANLERDRDLARITALLIALDEGPIDIDDDHANGDPHATGRQPGPDAVYMALLENGGADGRKTSLKKWLNASEDERSERLKRVIDILSLQLGEKVNVDQLARNLQIWSDALTDGKEDTGKISFVSKGPAGAALLFRQKQERVAKTFTDLAGLLQPPQGLQIDYDPLPPLPDSSQESSQESPPTSRPRITRRVDLYKPITDLLG